MDYSRNSPLVVISCLLLFSPQISFSAEKCHLLGSSQNITTSSSFKCRYKVGWKRHRLFKWASSFCLNRGYKYTAANTRYSMGVSLFAKGSKAATRRFKVISGLCIPKGQFSTEDRTKKCVRHNMKVTCNFALRTQRRTLRRYASGMCSRSNLKIRTSTTKYFRCSRNGKRCKKVVALCKR